MLTITREEFIDTDMNWFPLSNFYQHPFLFYKFMANTGPRREIIATMRLFNLAKIYRMRINVGLQYIGLINLIVDQSQ